MKRKSRFMTSSALVALLSFTLISNANAATESPEASSSTNYAQLEASLLEAGIASQQEVDNIITKLKNGETLDADKFSPSNSISASNSASTNAVTTDSVEGEKVVKYADGSYKAVSIEPQILSNPSLIGTNAYTKLYFKVTGSTVWGDASYYTSANIDTHLGNDEITGVSSTYIHTRLGVYSNELLTIVQKYENRAAKSPAKATLKWKWTESQNRAAETYNLVVNIGDHLDDQYGIVVEMTNALDTGYEI